MHAQQLLPCRLCIGWAGSQLEYHSCDNCAAVAITILIAVVTTAGLTEIITGILRQGQTLARLASDSSLGLVASWTLRLANAKIDSSEGVVRHGITPSFK